ncbi:MAG: ABC transporter ATP-binding protein [Bryobacteraceae bacterium]|nr:ABC transporter ATP-binding protein [Bryobacteraceae bacterium]
MIEARKLTKTYGAHTAVDGLDLNIERGTICAFLGPNGAGKSTAVKMLTGLLTPTSGSATVAGIAASPCTPALSRAVGVLPESLGLFDSLTVEEHLTLTGSVYGLTATETRERTDELLSALALDHGRQTFLDDCSYGMRKKTALAMALLPNPQVLFLDEPFEGLDPVVSRSIRDLLVQIAPRGVTIFLTSHILSIVEEIATHVMMIRAGKLVFDSRRDGLTQPLETIYFDLVEAPRAGNWSWLGSPQS